MFFVALVYTLIRIALEVLREHLPQALFTGFGLGINVLHPVTNLHRFLMKLETLDEIQALVLQVSGSW